MAEAEALVTIKPKKAAILQSSYIPWKGFFDIINDVDEFVLFDDVQYTKRDWRNRNRIKTSQGVRWLSIPVNVKGNFFEKIKDMRVANHEWARDHYLSIYHAYSKAPFFPVYKDRLHDLYNEAEKLDSLSEINYLFLRSICQILSIETRLSWSSDYELEDGKSERLLSICRQVGADTYVSGPSARDYLQQPLFDAEGVRVTWFNYDGYPEYPQPYPPFDHHVSIIDLILQTGPDASKHMKTFKQV
jgi:hypothetical protein